jgi:hypothetical protein
MSDPAALRQNIQDILVRLSAGGETDLAQRLIHPDFVNHEADPERSRGPEGAKATSEWLRSCFGQDMSFEVHHVLVDGDLAAAHVTMHDTTRVASHPVFRRHTSLSP